MRIPALGKKRRWIWRPEELELSWLAEIDSRLQEALEEIVQKSGNKNIVAKRLDQASLKSVREFAEDVNNNEAG